MNSPVSKRLIAAEPFRGPVIIAWRQSDMGND